MGIIKSLHTPTGIETRELTEEEIEEFAERGDDECRIYLYRQNEIIEYLQGITYEQLETYITNNITDLPSAKQYIIKLSKAVLLLIKLLRLDGDD